MVELGNEIGLTGIKLDSKTIATSDPVRMKGQGFAGIIGFSGDQMRGSLTIYCSLPCLQKTHPLREQVADLGDSHLKDWTGELANQLLGRLKNLVLKHKVTFGLGTPTVISATNIEVSSVEAMTTQIFAFSSDVAPIVVYFGALLKPEIDWLSEAPDSPAAVVEGDGLFF